jgi:hypothetical protein
MKTEERQQNEVTQLYRFLVFREIGGRRSDCSATFTRVWRHNTSNLAYILCNDFFYYDASQHWHLRSPVMLWRHYRARKSLLSKYILSSIVLPEKKKLYVHGSTRSCHGWLLDYDRLYLQFTAMKLCESLYQPVLELEY